MITSFSFGQMVIGADKHTTDLIILPDRCILPNWRRKEGHVLEMADLKSILPSRPDLIIAGTGVNDRMKPAPGLAKELLSMGIELKVLATDAAVSMFNTTITQTPDRGSNCLLSFNLLILDHQVFREFFPTPKLDKLTKT